MSRYAARISTFTRTAFLPAAAALLAACGPQDPAARREQSRFPPADVVATASQANAAIPLRSGQTLEIRLDGNSTIYPPVTWSLAAAPPILRPSGEEVLSEDPEAMGAGATWIFRFTAVAEGRGRLAFNGGESGQQARYEVVVARDAAVE
jgi:hypothetical protein